MRCATLSVAVLLVSTLAAAPARALETDQFYAWDRELRDVTDLLNAKVNLEIEAVLAEVNARNAGRGKSCSQLATRIVNRFRMFIFHDLELWAGNSPLIDRAPMSAQEELEFRDAYLLHDANPLDMGRWLPPSPTIEVNGIRIGTDKLAHFFSEGWWYYRWYRAALKRKGPERAERIALRRGLFFERTVLGMTSSGVLSPADLEANYQGMRFLAELCLEDEPLLVRNEPGWSLRRPFDFRDYVTPEWDESYQPNIFGKRRWKRVLPVLRRYCPMLDDPRVVARRERYERMDRVTPTERMIEDLVRRGKLADPARFALEANCDDPGARPGDRSVGEHADEHVPALEQRRPLALGEQF